MAEYIERRAAVEWFMGFIHMGDDNIPADTVISDLKHAIPAAEVEPVRHTTFKDGECMACDWFGDCVDAPHYSYCPGRGARADGGADNA